MKISDQIRTDFAWFQNHPEVKYFDNAATSLTPNCVVEAIQRYYHFFNTNPHNHDSEFCQRTNQVLAATRAATASFLGVAAASSIAFSANATHSLNLVMHHLASSLNPGDEVVLSYHEHASNLMGWIQLVQLKQIKLVYVEAFVLTSAAVIAVVTSKTKVVSLANATNLTGFKLDVNTLAQQLKQLYPNLLVVVDATQFLAHEQLQINEKYLDFVVASTHKLLGPTGLGILYVNPQHQANFAPLLLGGGMNWAISPTAYLVKPFPEAVEAGTINIASIFGWQAALNYYNQLGYAAIQARETALVNYLKRGLQQLPAVRLENAVATGTTILLNYDRLPAQDLARILGQHQIIVRAGLSCARLAHKFFAQQGVVRISLMFYNSFAELDALFAVLAGDLQAEVLNGLL